MKKVTEKEQLVLDFLKGKDIFISPTDIGNAIVKDAGSKWASPKCLNLVKKGYLERNDKGHYKVKITMSKAELIENAKEQIAQLKKNAKIVKRIKAELKT